MKGNLKNYLNELYRISNHKKLWLGVLGEVGHNQFILLAKTRSGNDLPRLLIAAGFHGEEIAGPWAILKWIQKDNSEILEKVDLSFLPLVNPTGFNNGKRYNGSGEKTNCGFCHTRRNGDSPSREGKVLIKSIDLLRKCAGDGFLSLHEDITSEKFYIYTFEKSKKPGAFTYALRDEERKFFTQALDGERVNEENDPEAIVHKGVVYKLHDGSFEDWLFHLGVPRCVVTETPGKKRLSKRIDAGVALIDKFISLSLEK